MTRLKSATLRQLNTYLVSFAFGIIIYQILAGSKNTESTNYYKSTSTEIPQDRSHRNIKNHLKVEIKSTSPQPLPTNLDGSLNIEKILEKTRRKIRHELISYNFNASGVQKIDDLIMESGGKPIRSLIISTWRSGTTFLGGILNAIPGNYYHYESLLYFGIVQIKGPPHSDKALSLIKNSFSCNFYDLKEYFEYGKGNTCQFNYNSRLWELCQHKKELCLDPVFVSKFCKIFPFQSMKLVRIRLQVLQELFEDKLLDNLNMVLLIRDPRGVMQSRSHHHWCKPSPDCWQPELVCEDMVSDYMAAGRVLHQYPGRLMVIRYEDLALNTNRTAYKLLKFLKLSATPSVKKYLHSHTTVVKVGVSSTFRISRKMPFRWKKALNFSDVKKIQMACKEAMDLWGYQMAHNASHLASKDFKPTRKFKVTQ